MIRILQTAVILFIACTSLVAWAQSDPTNGQINYMPMNGPWKTMYNEPASSIGATLDTTTKFIKFIYTEQKIYIKNTDGTAVKLPTVSAGKKFVLRARGNGGAKIRLAFKNSSYTSTYTTPYIGHNEEHIFTAPTERYVIVEVNSGVGSESSVRGYLMDAPVDCVGQYSACSKSCGGGTQTYTILTQAAFGGKSCEANNGSTRSCNVQSCVEYSTYENPFNRESTWNIKPVNPTFGSDVIPTDAYQPAIQAGPYSTGFFKASASDPAMTIYPRGSNIGVWDPAAETWLPTVRLPHWPADVVAATGSDGHADIYDPTTGLIHSFWILKYNTTRSRWEAQQWTTVKVDGTGWGTPAKYYSGARAVGVPSGGGIIRKHEINDGKDMYHHALAMSLAFSGLSPVAPGYIYPATSADTSYSQNTGKIPEGALLMLPPSFDKTTIQKPFMQKVVKTLMTYGARVVDRNDGTPYVIYIETGGNWPGHKDANGNFAWDPAYASDLNKIRAALRPVVSESGWVDKEDKPVQVYKDGTGLSLLSLRGPWKLQSGSVLGQFDSSFEELKWGATTTPTVQVNTTGNGANKVVWGKIVAGKKYRATFSSKNGASLNLEFRNSSYSLLYQTGLKQNEVVEFIAPSSSITLTAKSGTNVTSSSVSVKLEKLP